MTNSADPLAQAYAALAEGRGNEACRFAQVALQRDPTEPDALLILATEAIGRGDLDLTKRLCASARSASQNETGWLLAIEGRVALALKQIDTARTKARAAAVAGAPDAHVANEIGVLLARVGLHKPALVFQKYAAEEQPERADYQYNLATALQTTGDLTGAKKAFVRATRIDPSLSDAWLGLARLETDPEDAWISQLEMAFEDANDGEDKLVLGHALSRMLEEQCRWDRALEWLDRAKLSSPNVGKFDRRAVALVFSAAIKSAEAKIATEVADAGRVLFVSGLPRSGTTLVQRILDSHPRTQSRGETPEWILALGRRFGKDGIDALDAELIGDGSTTDDLLSVGDDYLTRIGVNPADTGKLVIDKTPFNIFYAPAILRALPGAQILCLKRSPFDVAFGIYRQLFGPDFADYHFSLDFAETVHFVARFEEMVRRFEEELPHTRFTTVEYEKVVDDLEGQARQMLEFARLDWDPGCVEFHKNPRPTATASAAQVREPIYSSAVERWRRYRLGSQRAIAEFAKYGITPPLADGQ